MIHYRRLQDSLVKRIFYYSGYRLTIFHWSMNKLISSYSFNPDDEGFSEFRKYLNNTENTPARIMVDVIEEEYKRETIPHVGGNDRKAIFSRIIERQYRESRDYASYRIIGREDTTRRDDKIIYSVLTNPGMLDPWMEVIEETNASVSGIWSVPLVSEHLLRKLDSVEENILLITQQVPSVMRLSFFKKGKFEISRTARVNTDEVSLGLLVSTEAEQTVNYLANQRYIGFDDKLTIHIISNESDINLIKDLCENTPLRTYLLHSVKEAQKKIDCIEKQEENCSGILSYICSEQMMPKGNYGHSSSFKKYYQQIISKALNFASIVLIVIALIIMAAYLSEADTEQQKANTKTDHAIALENDYIRKFNEIEPFLKQAKGIKSAVLLYENIKIKNIVTPQRFLNKVSKILSIAGMHNVTLVGVSWQSSQNNNIKVVANRRGPNINSKGINYANNIEIKHEARIQGYIRVSQVSLKEASQKIKKIVEALEKDKNVEKVEVLTMPLDSRPEAEFKNTTGIAVDRKDDDERKGQFEIKVLMRAG